MISCTNTKRERALRSMSPFFSIDRLMNCQERPHFSCLHIMDFLSKKSLLVVQRGTHTVYGFIQASITSMVVHSLLMVSFNNSHFYMLEEKNIISFFFFEWLEAKKHCMHSKNSNLQVIYRKNWIVYL